MPQIPILGLSLLIRGFKPLYAAPTKRLLQRIGKDRLPGQPVLADTLQQAFRRGCIERFEAPYQQGQTKNRDLGHA